MNPRLLLAWALPGLLLLSCHAAPPAAGPQAQSRRVLLVSLDGASVEKMRQLYQDGKLTAGGFSRFFQEGQVADRLIPVDPTVTSPNHISLATGYPPGRTGIVSNLYHPAGAPFFETVSGFVAPIGTETLWEAARRQGKRVGSHYWPGADGGGPRRRADWGLVYTYDPDPPAALVTVESGPGRPLPEAVRLRGIAAERLSSLPPGRWEDLPCRVTLRGGSSRDAVCPAKLLSRDPGGTARVYLGGVYPLPAYPDSLAAELTRAGLFWPGPADDDRLVDSWHGRPGIDLDTWSEQSERFARSFGDSLLLVSRRPDWDLLMGYMPVLDAAGHQLQLVDPRQPGFTPERRATLDAAWTRAWQSVDRQLARVLAEVDLRTTVVAVVSDHGSAPVHTLLRPNVLLREKGLLFTDSRGRILEDRTAAYAVTDDALIHVYVKPGREDLLPTLRRLLTGWKVGDEAPVERIFTRAEAAEVQMDHPNSGDLVAFLRVGYTTSNNTVGPLVSPGNVYGTHGYLNHNPQLHSLYMALGPGIPRGSAGTVRNLEIAGRVAGWLGIEKPRLHP